MFVGSLASAVLVVLLCLPLVAYVLTIRLLADFCVDHGSGCPKGMLYFIGFFLTPITLAVFGLLAVLSERNGAEG